MTTAARRIWGWFFFDWASQPYNTLLLTFIFAPYMTSLLGSGTAAQTVWGFGIGVAGVLIAVLSPLLGASSRCSMCWGPGGYGGPPPVT
jgi:UMF1 family MFS transporter